MLNAISADIVIAVIVIYLNVKRDIDLQDQLFIASFLCYCYEQNMTTSDCVIRK